MSYGSKLDQINIHIWQRMPFARHLDRGHRWFFNSFQFGSKTVSFRLGTLVILFMIFSSFGILLWYQLNIICENFTRYVGRSSFKDQRYREPKMGSEHWMNSSMKAYQLCFFSRISLTGLISWTHLCLKFLAYHRVAKEVVSKIRFARPRTVGFVANFIFGHNPTTVEL